MVHPVGKKKYLENEVIQYIADMNLILTYYKCLDDWEDDRKFTRLCYSSFITEACALRSVRSIRRSWRRSGNLCGHYLPVRERCDEPGFACRNLW